jgi:hypothetical protein
LRDEVLCETEEEFGSLVQRAIREGWIVKDARRHLCGARGRRIRERVGPRLFERISSKGGERLVVDLGCLDNPQVATPEAREELATVLRKVVAAVCPPASCNITPSP